MEQSNPFKVRDPDGLLLDVSSACAPDPAWAQRVRAREGGGHVERAPNEEGEGSSLP